MQILLVSLLYFNAIKIFTVFKLNFLESLCRAFDSVTFQLLVLSAEFFHRVLPVLNQKFRLGLSLNLQIQTSSFFS